MTALSSSRRTVQTVKAYGPDMRVTYNKLIRDRIPEVIQADGRHAVTRVLDSRSYQAALLAKLVEEARMGPPPSAAIVVDCNRPAASSGHPYHPTGRTPDCAYGRVLHFREFRHIRLLQSPDCERHRLIV